MEYQDLLSKEITMRSKRIQDEMKKKNIDACILTSSVNIFYTVGSIYNGYYYLPVEGQAIHFIKRNSEATIPNHIKIRKPEQIAEELQKLNIQLPNKILLETDTLSYNECNRIIATLNTQEVDNASILLRKIRSIKSDFELSQIKQCALKHVDIYKQIPQLYKAGMSDLDLQFEIEYLMRKSGSIGIFRSYGSNMDIYMGSLLVGNNAQAASPFDFALGGQGSSPILPLGASGTLITEGNTIMVDMAGNYSPWMTDITRVFSLGKVSDLAYKAHQVSIEIHHQIAAIAKEGIPCAQLYDKACKLVTKYKLDNYFMGTKQQAKFIGHGVGLEINEPPVLAPRSKEILEPNTVFALEPKFVIPQVGAVGIENTYLTTPSGLTNLTVLDEQIIDLA